MGRQYFHLSSVVHVNSYGPSRRPVPPIPNNIRPGKTDLFCRGWKQSNTVVSIVNIPKPRRSCSWTYKISREAESRIRHGSTQNAKRRSNTTRKHTRKRGKRENWTPARNNAHDNLVLSTELIMWISHGKEIRKLTFRVLALRRSNAHDNLVPEAEKREPGNEVEHMVDKNYVIFPELFRPWKFSGGPNRCRWTVENSRIRPHYEGVLSRTQ